MTTQRRRTEIIAEIGSSHNGLKEWAIEAIRLAKTAGADGVKFQFFGDPVKLVERRGLAASYVDAYRDFNVPAEWLPELRATARSHGLRFLCSVFRPEDVPVVAPFVDDFKVASLEAEDEALLEAIADERRPEQRVFVSVGRGASIEKAASIIGRDVIGLHCVSAYPAPVDELNLERIATESLAGYSDHSLATNTMIGAFAVASGASVLEVHLRLSATPESNPDFPHSRSPYQFEAYVANVRFVERALGDGANVEQPSEKALRESLAKKIAPTEIVAKDSSAIGSKEASKKSK